VEEYELKKMSCEINDGHLIRHSFKGLSEVAGLAHGVFTRHGGVSRPPYASLNVAWNNGDCRDAVHENLSRVKSVMGVDLLVAGSQVHGEAIHVVEDETLTQAHEGSPVMLTPPGDALVTQLRGVGLLIKIADCQAVFLVDPVRRVIANVHSGWRGSVLNLAGRTVRFLQDRFQCQPADMLAAVSPSLGPCCAEFKNYRHELPQSFWSFQSRPQYFDFWAITRRQLTDAGLNPGHIEVAERCTVCETNHFFSYRGEGATGRMAAVLAWKDTF